MAKPISGVKPKGASSWWKHLKLGKRMFWKRHRRAMKKEVK